MQHKYYSHYREGEKGGEREGKGEDERVVKLF
jgi:hypothetical protein